MKFVLASDGSRGDVEPCVAVGRELLRRGHEVRAAVPPNLVGFVESAGVAAVAYGLDTQILMEARRNLAWSTRNPWRVRDLIGLWRESLEFRNQCWREIGTTLTSLADEADLLLTGRVFEDAAANVAEYYDIPLATLHYVPTRPNGRLRPFLPAPLARSAMTMKGWLAWRTTKHLVDAQRRQLRLPTSTGPAARRIAKSGSMEIQAYDEICFPGLAAEWVKWNERKPPQRPFVGPLTMELATATHDEVASWIAAGTPPIFFGFGSMPVESPADTIDMIAGACADLGERALVGAGWSDFSCVPHFEHVKVVGAVNHAAIFPTCRAVVHHGGAGTTAAGLRAGVPTLILWWAGDQRYWAAAVKRLKVGAARRFSATTRESLDADLRRILAPQCVARAREIATRMTKPAESVAATADLVEDFARLRCAG
jgi:UDP:flavonoid glycosyltransferase YjiC (YdhE family)